MLNIDVSGDIVSSVLFLLGGCFVALLYIAHLIRTLKIGGSVERVIEKHYGSTKVSESEQEHEGETEEEKRARIQRDIDLENRWKKDGVESHVGGIGDKKVVDGKSSMNAVEAMRRMTGGENKSEQ